MLQVFNQTNAKQCDEAKPSCSGCASRQSACRYSNEVSRFLYLQCGDVNGTNTSPATEVAASGQKTRLRLKRVQETTDGKGVYHTFVTQQAAVPTPVGQTGGSPECSSGPPTLHPTSDTYRLQRHFAWVMRGTDYAGLQLRLMGQWLEGIVPRIGTHSALDRSIVCLITGHKVNVAREPGLTQRSHECYEQALNAVAQIVTAGNHAISFEAVTATKVLALFESVRRLQLTCTSR